MQERNCVLQFVSSQSLRSLVSRQSILPTAVYPSSDTERCCLDGRPDRDEVGSHSTLVSRLAVQNVSGTGTFLRVSTTTTIVGNHTFSFGKPILCVVCVSYE